MSAKKKNVVLKRKKIIKKEVVEEDVTNITYDILIHVAKISKIVVGRKKLP